MPAPKETIRPTPPAKKDEVAPPKPAPKEERPPARIDGNRTRSGLTAQDVDNLLNGGYTMADIMLADALAARHGVGVTDLLGRVGSGQTLDEVVSDLVKNHPAANVQPAGAPDGPSAKDVAARTGLTEQQVADLRGQGYSDGDLAAAKAYADRFRLPLTEVLKKKGRGTWTELARRLSANSSPSLLSDVAKASGLSKDQVKALMAIGNDLTDLRQAAELARVSGKSIAEILALRAGRPWATVAQELKPPEHPPQHPNPPNQKGGP